VVDVSDEQQVIAGFAERSTVWPLDNRHPDAGFPIGAVLRRADHRGYRAQMSVAMDGGFYTLREAAGT